MRLPQDLANLVAVAVRDANWYKPSVFGFLKECGVPELLMKDVRGLQQENTPTVKIVHHVLDRLDTFDEPGCSSSEDEADASILLERYTHASARS